MNYRKTVNTLLDSIKAANAFRKLPIYIKLALESMIPPIIKISITLPASNLELIRH